MDDPIALETAISLAAIAHLGQKDKSGETYILHPLRVMMKMTTTKERIVAVLHEVFEDSKLFTFELLATYGCDEEIIEALRFLTKLPEEENDYEAFIRRILTGPKLAQQVKIEDIKDNLDRSRTVNPTARDFARWEKYEKALKLLEANQ